eukprot:CAMPEP_0117450640 /NCGR_PEP_ID=MMETSP0759-20121206/8578_1 /TAXON_ID=63605 /ORGANISM="Percolomonas cosmopolitus, Strain WS" /LENGTH=632 /DNA_ID=CAMNT_0005243179 /DNA_START=317 /DNA_END=2215 /DNA_ORIENTATION=+
MSSLFSFLYPSGTSSSNQHVAASSQKGLVTSSRRSSARNGADERQNGNGERVNCATVSHNGSSTSNVSHSMTRIQIKTESMSVSLMQKEMDTAAPLRRVSTSDVAEEEISELQRNPIKHDIQPSTSGTYPQGKQASTRHTEPASHTDNNNNTTSSTSSGSGRKRPQNPLRHLRSKSGNTCKASNGQEHNDDHLTKEQEASLKKEFATGKKNDGIELEPRQHEKRNKVSSPSVTRAMVTKFTRERDSVDSSNSGTSNEQQHRVSEDDYKQHQEHVPDSSISNRSTFKMLVQDIRKNDEITKGTTIKNRYTISSEGTIGSGSFGEIYEVEYLKTGGKYALKVIPPRFKRQARSEQKYLTMLREFERNHVIRFEESFVWKGKICFIFELLSYSLYDMLQYTNFKGLKLKIVQIIGRQILSSLEYLGSMRIIHCDLKPENILLCPIKERHFREEHLRIKLIDFGSACNVLEGPFVKYIQSRFYRAPEVILEHKYSYEIDLWSLGCILFELHTGLPLFAGENETEMIQLMVSLLGTPPKHMLHSSNKACKWFTFNSEKSSFDFNSSLILPRETLRQKLSLDTKEGPRRLWRDGRGYQKEYYEVFHDALQKMLQWDPQSRTSLRDLLRHPFFTLKFDK